METNMSMILTLSVWEMRAAVLPFNTFFELSHVFLSFLSSSLRLRQLCSLTLDVIIFVLVSYCWHFNSGAPQSGLTQTARNHTSQPSLTAALVASNFSQIKGLFYLVFFFSLRPCTVRKQTRLLAFDLLVASGFPSILYSLSPTQ